MALDVRGVTTLLQVYDMPTSVRFYRDVLALPLAPQRQQPIEPLQGVQRAVGLQVAGDDFAGMFEQHGENLKGLFLKFDLAAILVEFARAQVESVHIKS